MHYHTRRLVLAAAVLGFALWPHPGHAQDPGQAGGWAALDRALGRPGKAQPGDVQKYSFPRSDLRVTVAGVTVKPALALGSWVAFRRTSGAGGNVMAMGDLVLTEDEVPTVIAKLQAGGIRQTALHNHLQRESPRVMYLHLKATGTKPSSVRPSARPSLPRKHLRRRPRRKVHPRFRWIPRLWLRSSSGAAS